MAELLRCPHCSQELLDIVLKTTSDWAWSGSRYTISEEAECETTCPHCDDVVFLPAGFPDGVDQALVNDMNDADIVEEDFCWDCKRKPCQCDQLYEEYRDAQDEKKERGV